MGVLIWMLRPPPPEPDHPEGGSARHAGIYTHASARAISAAALTACLPQRRDIVCPLWEMGHTFPGVKS